MTTQTPDENLEHVLQNIPENAGEIIMQSRCKPGFSYYEFNKLNLSKRTREKIENLPGIPLPNDDNAE